jgi:hypothetical protein
LTGRTKTVQEDVLSKYISRSLFLKTYFNVIFHPYFVLLYKAILNPIWTYGIQLWGMASNSNLELLGRFQWKTLRMILDVPWYVPNMVIRRDLQIQTVKEEIQRYSARLSAHPNYLVANLMELPDKRRL